MAVQLLLLPIFAQEEIVKCLSLQQMYFVHSLSRRSSRVVRLTTRRCGDIHETAEFESRAKFFLKRDGTKHRFGYIEVEDVDSSKRVIKFVADAFKVVNFSMVYHSSTCTSLSVIANDILPLIYELSLRSHEIHITDRTRSAENDEALKAILKQSRNAAKLLMNVLITQQFELSYEELGEMHCDSVSLYNCHWVNIDHILNCFMSCKKVELAELSLNVLHLPRIVEKWEQGCQLEEMSFHYASVVPFRTIFPEMPERDQGAVVIKEGVRFRSQEYFVVRQENGTEALVGIIPVQMFTISTHFEIAPV